MLDVTCGKCGHQADLELFQMEGHSIDEFKCPSCDNAWAILGREEAERAGHQLTHSWKLRVQVPTPERPVIYVPAERLEWGTFGLKEGDIHAAYTADQKPKIRKPFQHEGRLWANWGGSSKDVRCCPLIPHPEGTPPPGERVRYSYEHEIVFYKKQCYACGPEHAFVALDRGPSGTAEVVRRMFAYGGHFAFKAGRYRVFIDGLLDGDKLTEMERMVYEIERDADLPQTQQGMLELFEPAHKRKAA